MTKGMGTLHCFIYENQVPLSEEVTNCLRNANIGFGQVIGDFEAKDKISFKSSNISMGALFNEDVHVQTDVMGAALSKPDDADNHLMQFPKAIKACLKIAVNLLAMGKNPEYIMGAIENKFGNAILKKAKRRIEKLFNNEYGLLGHVYVCASILNCKNNRKDLPGITKNATYIMAEKKCFGCKHASKNYCSLYRKNLTPQIVYNKKLLDSVTSKYGMEIEKSNNIKKDVQNVILASMQRKVESDISLPIYGTIASMGVETDSKGVSAIKAMKLITAFVKEGLSLKHIYNKSALYLDNKNIEKAVLAGLDNLPLLDLNTFADCKTCSLLRKANFKKVIKMSKCAGCIHNSAYRCSLLNKPFDNVPKEKIATDIKAASLNNIEIDEGLGSVTMDSFDRKKSNIESIGKIISKFASQGLPIPYIVSQMKCKISRTALKKYIVEGLVKANIFYPDLSGGCPDNPIFTPDVINRIATAARFVIRKGEFCKNCEFNKKHSCSIFKKAFDQNIEEKPINSMKEVQENRTFFGTSKELNPNLSIEKKDLDIFINSKESWQHLDI